MSEGDIQSGAENKPLFSIKENVPAPAEKQPEKQAAPPRKRINFSFNIKAITSKITERYLIAIALYFLIALIMFAPIAANITASAPGSGGDTYLNLWDIWWVNHALLVQHTSIWSTTLLYWPIGSNLVYQTMAPIGSFFFGFLQGVSIPFAYNSMFFAGFVLSGLTMFILAYYLTKNPYAAFFAGLAFTFSSVHIPLALDHIDWIMIAWIPLALYFFLRMLREYDKKYINALGLGISFVLIVFMGDIEQGIMTLLLLAMILVIYALYKGTRHFVFNKRTILAIGVALVVAFLLGSFGFLPLLSTITQPGGITNANYLNDIQHNEIWSDDVLSFFLPSYYNGFFNGIATSAYSSMFAAAPSERSAYIGYTVLAMALFGMYKTFKKTRMWIAIAVVFGLMALGPFIQIDSLVTPIPGLFYLYHILPGISVIREPGRFDVIFTIAIAALAAFGINEFMEEVQKKGSKGLLGNKKVFISILCILFLIESNGYPLTSALMSQDVSSISIPPFYTILGTVQGNFSVLQLPILPNSNSSTPELYIGEASYYQTAHHHPIIGGDITRVNESEEISLYNMPLIVQAAELQSQGVFGYASPIRQNFTNQTLLTLFNYNTAFIAVQKSAYSASSLVILENYLYSVFGAPVYDDNLTVAFQTANATRASVYRNYVTYPILPDWQETSLFLNGSNKALWVPLYPGAIEVYAPYKNVTTALRTTSKQYWINTTMSLEAISPGGPARLEIGALQQSGNITEITTFNITSKLGTYSVRMAMPSGPVGSTMFFVVDNGTSAYSIPNVGISNITFSRS
jgi:hypothetical protein